MSAISVSQVSSIRSQDFKKSENFPKIWKLSSKSVIKNCHHEIGEHSHLPKSRPSKHYNGKHFTDMFIIVRKRTTSYHQNQVIWRDFRHCLPSNLTLSQYNAIRTYLPFYSTYLALFSSVVFENNVWQKSQLYGPGKMWQW